MKKPQEFWIKKGTEPVGAQFTNSYVLGYFPDHFNESDFVHVIDKSAFDKVVEALKFYAHSSYPNYFDDGGKFAQQVLKEIGITL